MSRRDDRKVERADRIRREIQALQHRVKQAAKEQEEAREALYRFYEWMAGSLGVELWKFKPEIMKETDGSPEAEKMVDASITHLIARHIPRVPLSSMTTPRPQEPAAGTTINSP